MKIKVLILLALLIHPLRALGSDDFTEMLQKANQNWNAADPQNSLQKFNENSQPEEPTYLQLQKVDPQYRSGTDTTPGEKKCELRRSAFPDVYGKYSFSWVCQ